MSILTTISQAQDSKIDLTTHGRLSLGYFGNNGAFTGNNNAPGLFGLNAHIMANFGLNENWNVGMGAAGIWNVWALFPFNNIGINSNGDVSDIYVAYKNGGFKLVAGRYNVDKGKTIIRTTDFLNGPLQGVSLQWIPDNVSAFRMWFSYINSFLDNGFLPGRIGSELASLAPYFSSGKIKLGGEVFVLGADYNKSLGKTKHRIFFAPWILLNTKAPATNPTTTVKLDPLFQIGVKGRLRYEVNEAWESFTTGNGVFQYGNGLTPNTTADDILGFFIIDEELKYTRKRTNQEGKQYVDYSISMGAGFRGIFGNQNARFFTINDRNRFYGRFLNGANYNVGNTLTFYIFGKMQHRFFEVQALLGAGTYSELSLTGFYKAYRQKRLSDEGSVLGFDIGAGYSFASSSVETVAGNHGFMLFGKLSY
ncbi:hypothetical protein LS73_007280 [Helicobacter muridarum]|uniref:Outer membrane protein n=1 Tax=Helicobacter muridarum TaxID=216 RepID=A0A4V6YSD5_9HELI|nr:hypothetical protein LS73_007280 [Helicobacter muridarum]